MQIEFKPAVASDQETLMALRYEFCEYESFPNPLDEKTNRAVLGELIENERLGRIWLILAEGETSGYVVLVYGFSLEYSGRNGVIDELFLRRRFRGLGIGKQTIAFIEEFCRSQNIKTIHLEVDHTNITAKTLYHRTGFVDHGRLFLTKWI